MVIDTRAGEQGFTIIELMVGLLVAAIVLGFGVPSMTHVIRSNQLTNQGNGILGAIQYARAEAARLGEGTAVCGSSDGQDCDGEWGHGWLVFRDPDGNETDPQADEVLRVSSGNPSIDDASGGVVRFDHRAFRRPTGTGAGESAATVGIKRTDCASEKARRITIERGGRSSLEEVAC